MIKSEKGMVEIEGKAIEVLADLSVVIQTLREDGVLTRRMYELIWKMPSLEEYIENSTTIDIEELRRQMNDTV